jgi:PhzF family phenazine biosynthesis protein
MLVLDNEDQVRNISPDFSLLADVETRGVMVTAPGHEVDFVSRFFAPAVGIEEDPVTGSAHTMLVPYWSGRLEKNELDARQISARGGALHCKLLENDRLEISGQACTFMKGEIELSSSE